MLKVNSRIAIPLEEFDFTYSRSGGPGGQNVNKVNSKVTLHWDVSQSDSLPIAVKERFMKRYHRRITNEGKLVLNSQRYRDQGRNVSDCLDKLRDLIQEVATPPKPRTPTRATRGSRERRIKEKKQKSEKKQRRRRIQRDD